MMLTFLAPVLSALPADGKGKIGLALAIPVGANIGGMGTPIGTPPNAIALKFLNDPNGMDLGIGFGKWMMVMVPLTLVLLFIAWLVLKKLFPFKQKEIHLQIESNHSPHWKDKVVYATFAVTILLWLTDSITGSMRMLWLCFRLRCSVWPASSPSEILSSCRGAFCG